VIESFKHVGLEKFFRTGSKAGIQPDHAKRLRIRLAVLDRSVDPEGMNIPGWRLRALSSDMDGHWSVWVDGNWRITFGFEGPDAILVDYRDYH